MWWLTYYALLATNGDLFGFCILAFIAVGRRSPVGLRVGALGRPRGIATPTDLEQPISFRFWTEPNGRSAAGKRNDPRKILHSALQMPSRQHIRIPGMLINFYFILSIFKTDYHIN